MPNFPSRFKSFVENLSKPELCNWIVSGLQRFHTNHSPAYHRADLAFDQAKYVFGQLGIDREAEEELLDVYEYLESIKPTLFDAAVAHAIDEISLNSAVKSMVFRSLVQIALNTKNSIAIAALTNKLKLIDESGLKIVYADLAYFLHEGHDQPKLVTLGCEMLKHKYPEEITAFLLLGMLRLDLDNALYYARQLAEPLSRQIDYLKTKHPEQFEKLQEQFCDEVLRMAENSSEMQEFACLPVYANLLAPALNGEIDEDKEIYSLVAVISIYVTKRWRVAEEVLRPWIIRLFWSKTPVTPRRAAETTALLENFLGIREPYATGV